MIKKDPKKKKQVDVQGRKFPCRRVGQCKGPKEEVCLASLRKTGGQGGWSRMKGVRTGEEVREVTREQTVST